MLNDHLSFLSSEAVEIKDLVHVLALMLFLQCEDDSSELLSLSLRLILQPELSTLVEPFKVSLLLRRSLILLKLFELL